MTFTPTKLTLADYLAYHDGTDRRYELVDGVLRPMSQPSGRHGAISEFLNDEFRTEIHRLGRDWVAKQGLIGVEIPRLRDAATVRIPDVSVVTLSQWQSLYNREAVLTDSAPLLVVEVVSCSSLSEDYRRKRVEYNTVEIPEYWIVDAIADPRITLFTLVEGLYEVEILRGSDRIPSRLFSELDLTVERVLQANS
ncbi:MAG: Uma2 family endonuclease [Thermostichus sp. HHBFW_bins_43]